MGVRVLCPSCHRSLEAFRLHGGFQAGPLSPSTSRVYGRRRQSWQSNTAESVDHAREPGSPRQKMAVALSVQERIPPEQLVRTLARQQDLAAGPASTRRRSCTRLSPTSSVASCGSTAFAGSYQRRSVVSSVSRLTLATVPGANRDTPSIGVSPPWSQPLPAACASSSRRARRGIPAASRDFSSLANHSAPLW